MPANLTNIKDQGVDIANIYVGSGDLSLISDSYLSSTGLEKKVSGTLWAWGRNKDYYTVHGGELGLGDTIHRSSPVQVGSLTNWKQLSGDAYTVFAVKTDNTLWAWGRNYGSMLTGDTVHRSSPVQVTTSTDWMQVSGAQTTIMAIKTNGTLWAWGFNNKGQLGLGDITDRSSPVQVGTLTNWKQVSCSQTIIHAIKTDGTLWAWGGNDIGVLGLGDTNSRSSPVQVGSLNNWSFVDNSQTSTLAIKTDGTLWSWGGNARGQLGLGNTTHRSSPVQVGALTNWKQVSTYEPGYSYVLAVKTDGTLWSWGHNYYGQLGLNNQTDCLSPVQVGALTNWKQVSAGYYGGGNGAVKTDGTLWTWGSNSYGVLGLNDTARRRSPVQVGTLTNWKEVFNGVNYSMFAVK